MGGMNLDEVKSGFLASFDGSNPGIFDTLDVVLGHRSGLRVIGGVGNVARTIHYSLDQVNEAEIEGLRTTTNHCLANRPHLQVPGFWGP